MASSPYTKRTVHPRKKQPVDILTALVLREIKSMKPAPNRLMTMARWLQAPIAPAYNRGSLSYRAVQQLTRLACDCIATTETAVFTVSCICSCVKFLTPAQVAELEVQIDSLYNAHNFELPV